MRALTVTAGVLLSIVAVFLAVVAGGLFLDGDAGAGGLAVFFVMVTLLCALLLFRAAPRRATAPRRRPRGQSRPGDSGFYYGDSTPAYGAAAGRSDDRGGGDGGADGGRPGHGYGGGWAGADAGADGGSSGSDGGGGGSDGGGGSGGSD